jgi:hypothetical protein
MGKVDPSLLEHLTCAQNAGASCTIFLLPGIFMKGCNTAVGFLKAGADTCLEILQLPRYLVKRFRAVHIVFASEWRLSLEG